MVNVVVIWVAETTLTAPTVMFVPALTVAPDKNPVPVMVTLNVLPSGACELGVIELTVGAGFALTVNPTVAV